MAHSEHLVGKKVSKDIRSLEVSEVCELGDWLTNYMRLEPHNRVATDSKQLIPMLVGNSREYESDLGLFLEDD